MKRRDLEALKAAQLADAEGQMLDPEAHAGELTSGQRWRRLRAWFWHGMHVWTHRLEHVGKWLTALLKVLGGVGAIVGLGWRAIVFYKTRGIAPAEQQATGVASTAVDRVDKPQTK